MIKAEDSNRLVRRLLHRYGEASAEGAIEKYVEDRLHEANQLHLPINVGLIASLLGVKCRVAHHPFAGRIYAEDSRQLIMDLNAGDSEPRQRFTCAHELIHTAFPGFTRETRYRLDVSVGSHHAAHSDEEYLCDVGASMMLMPARLVTPRFCLKRGLAAIEELARKANVSLEAAGNRLVTLSDVPGAFLVLDVCHKPADRAAIRRGHHVDPRLRVRYAALKDLTMFVPPFKSVSPDSVYSRATRAVGIVQGVDELPGSRSHSMRFHVQACCYPRFEAGREICRVLATAISSASAL